MNKLSQNYYDLIDEKENLENQIDNLLEKELELNTVNELLKDVSN